MIKNYLKTALRSFLKHRTFTLLNVVGLSLGLVASLLILQYVKYERSFDRHITRADDIYRVEYDFWQNGKLRFECAAAVPAVGAALKTNFPEVERFTRLYPVDGVISYESPENGLIAHREEKIEITDSSVFKVFSWKLIKGEADNVLRGPNKAVISQKAAKKYFGTTDPIGKTIKFNADRFFEVSGVFEDVPENSHIKPDFLLSYETIYERNVPVAEQGAETNWGWYDFNTYVLLQPGTDVPALQAKWDEYVYKLRHEAWEQRNNKQAFVLKPITDIHLYANLLQESEPDERGDGDSVYALTFIALFILIIAWVNYINLATAKSFDRANEVGVRKAMGAQASQLRGQFLAESFLVNLFASTIAILAVALLWPLFSKLSGRPIPISYMLDADFWLLLIGLFVGGTLLSGFYPAMVLSRFKPVSVLKGKVVATSQGSLMRKSLVVFQFSASVMLIVGSIVVFQQLRFMSGQKLGIDINQTLVVKGPGVVDSTFQLKSASFKSEIMQIAGVKSVASSSNVPGDEIFWANGIRRLSGGPEGNIQGYNVGIDHEYVKGFGLTVVAGRSFDLAHPNDEHNVMMNRAMVEALDFKSPEEAIGQRIIQGDTMEIVGVLENYHQMSLKEAVVPLVFRYTPTFARFFAIKVEGDNNYNNVLSAIEEPWNRFFPGNPIDYFYLDQFFGRQYESDRQFGSIFTLFTGLAIFIACLGLFGLASFLTTQRTKEIGIRKVLGSSVVNIVLLLSRGFIQLVLVANLIAWPLAWYAMNNWLQGFPYRITLNPLWFILAGGGVVLIAFASVGFQTLKAALVNPARTLKYE
ncbi:MAG TPA: ABC transporter permease [Cyclobacteriaceae bacterium]|nr:ABC transporter permease [Cyclobacteriaceae bacterium]